jgi:hypothetical protein
MTNSSEMYLESWLEGSINRCVSFDLNNQLSAENLAFKTLKLPIPFRHFAENFKYVCS